MNTKELILEEALKQFSQKGFDGTSMSDIAAPLEISKAALYKHYKSKQEIFDKIIDARWDELNNYQNGDLLNRFNSVHDEASRALRKVTIEKSDRRVQTTREIIFPFTPIVFV